MLLGFYCIQILFTPPPRFFLSSVSRLVYSLPVELNDLIRLLLLFYFLVRIDWNKIKFV
jgi:hypothetical protein